MSLLAKEEYKHHSIAAATSNDDHKEENCRDRTAPPSSTDAATTSDVSLHDNHHPYEEQHHNNRTDNDDNSSHTLSRWQAMMHLIKGNLGPGCLNLPAAFGSTGWAAACALFAVVALQGIYSMWLLVQCKKALQSTVTLPPSSSSSRHNHHHNKPPQTFMQVAHAALGPAGSRTTELFLFILQGGVCCVFLSLVQTNLVAAAGGALSDTTATAAVTVVLISMTFLRFLTDLTWTSVTANAVMMITIATAATAGWRQYTQLDSSETAPAVIWNAHAIVKFFPMMFFAFEGIGLVLPIENAYPNNTNYTNTTATSTAPFETVLIQSMMITASLFCAVGIFASLGFPDLTEADGSVTAYLHHAFPHNAWYTTLNAAVTVAVLLTFPLQLQPAMQVLDQWLDQDIKTCRLRRRRRLPLATTEEQAEQQTSGAMVGTTGNDDDDDDDSLPTPPEVLMESPHHESSGNFQLMERNSHDEEDENDDDDDDAMNNIDPDEPDGLVRMDSSNSSIIDPLDSTWCCGIPQWLIRRWMVVLACAVIVLTTDNLSLLIGIFGAVGQTGLAAMPCAIHLALQHEGLVDKSMWKTCLHCGLLLFCGAVMISSLILYATTSP